MNEATVLLSFKHKFSVCSTGRVHQTKVNRYKEGYNEKRRGDKKQMKKEENEEIIYLKQEICMVYHVVEQQRDHMPRNNFSRLTGK